MIKVTARSSIPLDFGCAPMMGTVVDFLRRQMRSDERPIVVHARPGFALSEAGQSFGEGEREPGSGRRCRA